MCIANTYYGLKILKLHYLHFGYFHDILTVPFPHSSFLVMASWIDYSWELSQNLCCAIYVAFKYNGSYYFSFLISRKKHFNKKLQVIEYAHLKYFFCSDHTACLWHRHKCNYFCKKLMQAMVADVETSNSNFYMLW